jgi:putative transposase
MKNDLIPFDLNYQRALFRYQVISNVLLREANGEVRSAAVEEVAGTLHFRQDGQFMKVSRSSIYRWLNDYEEKEFEGLFDKPRKSGKSTALSENLLAYFIDQKNQDPIVSIPELIKRAKSNDKLAPDVNVDRVTVWRSLKRTGVNTSRRKATKKGKGRRFAYPHRMDMVICDGKHFRAGLNRLRRMAFFYIDDATRLVLNVKVGTSENTQLFLQGLYETIQFYGRMSALFVDNGPGFSSHDSVNVLQKLGVLFIHGTPNYPEGRAKVERFNRTAQDQVLRYLSGNPEIDPDCSALELRLRHYLSEIYAHTGHTSLNGDSPFYRFQNDTRKLRFFENMNQLESAFILHNERQVSLDNVISYKGIYYDVPFGYAKTKVMLHRNMLDGTLSIIHDGCLHTLTQVDLHANARRAMNSTSEVVPENDPLIIPKGSAQIEFERDYKPVIDHLGGFSKKEGKV